MTTQVVCLNLSCVWLVCGLCVWTYICILAGTVVALLIRLAVLFGEKACCYEVWQSDVHVMQIVQFIILGIVIFVVAVPEGLVTKLITEALND